MDMEMKVYIISLENYHGETYKEYYFQKKHAFARFIELKKEGKMQDKFEFYQDHFQFFDANYNEYSTYITLTDCALKDLFMDEMEANK